MPIKFISLNKKFIENMGGNYESHLMKIQDYVPDKKTYYVSAANSLCFMDGGIDYALSRIVFPGIETVVKQEVKCLNIKNMLGRAYLPIGSSIVIDYSSMKSLIVAPTMLLPQDVSGTSNAYYSTMAVLCNILLNKNENIDSIDIIFTSMCCGYGKMDEMTSIKQILAGIADYQSYSYTAYDSDTIVSEPNLGEQPKIYQNTEWFGIRPEDVL